MARDPNDLKYPEQWITADQLDTLRKLPPPAGVSKPEWDAKIAGGNYYANVKTYQNGRRVIEWYQQGAGGGPGKPDPIEARGEDTLPDIKAEWDAEEAKGTAVTQRQQEQSQRQVKEKKPVRDPDSPTGWTEVTTYEDGSESRIVGIKSPEDKPVAATPATVATSTTEPFIVTRRPDGSLQTDANPNYRGPEQKPGATHFSVGGDGRTYAIPIDAQGRPGQAVDVGLPAKPTEVQSPYSRIEQDPDTKKWYGLTRDGKWQELPPGGPGSAAPAAAGSAPPLPAMVIGQSQAALREYHASLQREVSSGRRTDAWARERFNEALAVARQTVDEATLIQSEGQSRRNADVSLMNNRQNAATTGFGQALDTVNAGNKYLPKGSTLGGEAFAALLGLQRSHAERMGAYTDPYGSQTGAGAPPGAPGAAPGAPPPAAPAGAAAPPPASTPAKPLLGPPPPLGADPMAGQTLGGNLLLTIRNKVTQVTELLPANIFQSRPDRDQFDVIDAKPPGVPAPLPVDPATAPPGASVAPDQSSGLMLRTGLNPTDEMPPTGIPSAAVPERGPTAPPPYGAQFPVAPVNAGPPIYYERDGGLWTTTPGADQAPAPNWREMSPMPPGPLDPRSNRPDIIRQELEDPNNPNSIYKTSLVAPQQEFAVLAQPQPAPLALPQMAAQAPAAPEPFAMMAARIKSTPPWRLSQNDFNQFVSAGGDPADFWSDGITGVLR